MSKTTHTHRGTCQACGSVQASDNVSAFIAKHGYEVVGYFVGTCQGSDRKPAEHEVTYTHKVIDFCTATAQTHDESIVALQNGAVVPETFKRWNSTKLVTHTPTYGKPYNTTGGDDVLPIAKASQAERAKAIKLAIHDHELIASQLRSHAKGLIQYVLPRLGQPLYAVADLNKPVAKPAAPTVDVKAAKVVGTFATKAARKEALDRLNRTFDKAQRRLQGLYLAMPRDQRTEAKTEVYYGPSQLNHWRPKHSRQALNEFPEAAGIVEEIEQLVAAREAVKAAP